MSSGLRILFVTHAYPRFAEDGAGSFLHRLAVSLRASGCELRVLAPSGKDLPATTEDEYYAFELVGLQVVEETGRSLGTVEAVTPGVANDVRCGN